ncbi:MAG TPA: hypothetical protein VIT23_07095, partial [Terrimicrobiaceae bacterium]
SSPSSERSSPSASGKIDWGDLSMRMDNWHIREECSQQDECHHYQNIMRSAVAPKTIAPIMIS